MTERRIVRHEEPKLDPWLRPGVQANRISSADLVENHPALCYEFGDPNGEPFVPDAVIEAMLNREEFTLALWQQDAVMTIQVSRRPGKENKNGWCDVIYYQIKLRNPELVAIVETEPQEVTPELLTALCTPLGYPLKSQGELFRSNDPILRVVFEFSDAVETERLPFDTSLAALGWVAYKSYQDTIYGSDTV